MTEPRRLGDNSLVELLDRLVQTGVVATGDVLLGLADVDLIRVNLQLVLGAVDTLMADNDNTAPGHSVLPADSGVRNYGAAPQHSAAPVEQHSAPPVGQHNTPRVEHHNAARVEQHNAARVEQPRSGQLPVVASPATALAFGRPDSSDRADLGVGGLLVAVVEIVHRLLERQAIHRMEHGSLTSEQTERLGQALMALDQRINQLIEIFGVRSSSALPATVAGTAH
jgi:hypothetical protein